MGMVAGQALCFEKCWRAIAHPKIQGLEQVNETGYHALIIIKEKQTSSPNCFYYIYIVFFYTLYTIIP